ncbi:MAG: TIGR03621 family F420-dependent LLM class oxidoreductase [Actinomycetota bacterium]
MQRPIRFGHQIAPTAPFDELVVEAKAAESAGFDVITVPDHIGTSMASPLPLLAAIARETSTIRVGTFVLNNEMRNPVQLAWEAATLDRLSGGRFELGIGAGHTPHEFTATGIDMAGAADRKARLADAVHIIRGLLDGETVSHDGEHYQVDGAAIEPAAQDRLPIMIGGNGQALLTDAGRQADIVGLNGLRRTLDDGHRHSVGWSIDRLERQIGWVHDGAAYHGEIPELNALVQRIEITDDREAAATALADQAEGLSVDEALSSPYVAFGTHDEIADQFLTARERWGLSYFVTRNIEAMTPIIERIRAED